MRRRKGCGGRADLPSVVSRIDDMAKRTRQTEEWSGEFGKDYTARNAVTLEELDLLYKNQYGITRTQMNHGFIGGFDKDMRVLEVGSNIGNQLLCLQKMGFRDLYGVELQWHAVELAKTRTQAINIIQGSAFDIPFKDRFFDLVFTSGLMIHIAPQDIAVALDEMHRCTRRYIWGFEYYAERYTQVSYRGHSDLLWKTDFSSLFLERFKSLRLVREERFKYLQNESVDSMFLLEKRDDG